MSRCLFLLSCCLLTACWLLPTMAGEPCRSGLQAGARPGPYAALQSTGPQRGQPHCYVCEVADRPAVIIFAREPSESLGRLLRQLDDAVVKHRDAQLRAWATFLSDNEPALEPKLVEFSRRHGLSNLPLGVFEDLDGPPSYKLSRDADITVLLSVKQKVGANFAFRTGELTEEKIKEIMNALPRILNPS